MTSSVYSNLVSCWILLRIIRKGYFVLNILSHLSEVDQLQQIYSIIISFLEAIKLSLHPTSSKAIRNYTLVCPNIYIIANQSYIAKITFRLKLLFFTYKIGNNFVVLFDFAKMELLLTYAVWRPFWDWTLYSLSGCILLEGHYMLKNSVLGHARQYIFLYRQINLTLWPPHLLLIVGDD